MNKALSPSVRKALARFEEALVAAASKPDCIISADPEVKASRDELMRLLLQQEARLRAASKIAQRLG